MTYIVCPTKNRNLSGVFCFAFDSDLEAAEKFAADITLATWEAWRGVGSPSGFSGCEGLAMYLHASTNEDHTEFVVLSVFVQGKKFAADAFDEATEMTDTQRAWVNSVLEEARNPSMSVGLIDYNVATGPAAQILSAVIALEASYEDPIGLDEEHIPEVQEMILRLIEMWTGKKRPTFPQATSLRAQVLDQVRVILSGIPEDTGLTADEMRLEVAERIVEGFPKGIQPDVDIDLAQAANLINEAGTYLGGTLHPEQ